ncbi:MAG: hypothetical protein RBG13Loki_0783 [Promethearchaeota archaeon CR_4]|nr:MAG: hypothetical protein RBG13Loki_0783 [Candidatus Lokiarchaeota archaeon CR_4]
MKTKLLDYLLVTISLVAIFLSSGFMVYIIFGFPEFHLVPFFEFIALFILGLVGFRFWQKETNE